MAIKYYWKFNNEYIVHEITVSSMDELRRRLAQKMSKTKVQSIFVSKYKTTDRITPTSFKMYNTYWGSIHPGMGEVYTYNGMRAFDKRTGQLGGKTGL